MAVAVINGTMLTPGVSLNNRLYTPKVIAKAVARMQERIADPNGLPIIMRTHHQAGDNSRLIVGKLTSVKLEEDGSATYQSQLYGTQPGQDIATLVTGEDPALRSVSISGGWLGPVRTTEYKGKTVETAEDLEIDAVDFTATPGVVGALISKGTQKATESSSRWTPISESYEATVSILEEAPAPTLAALSKKLGWTLNEMREAQGLPKYIIDELGKNTWVAEADKKPYGDVPYADPGKQSDGVKRYPIDTAAHAKAAWSYINMPKNAKKYSSADLAAIKGRIKAAMKKFGIKVGEESAVRFSDIKEYYPYGPDGDAGFCIDAYAGPLSVTVRGCVSGEELRAAAIAAVNAAMGVFATMDPDEDGDIDIPGAENEPELPRAESVTIEVEGSVISETDLREMVQKMMKDLSGRPVAEAAGPDDNNMESGGDGDAGTGATPVPPGDASHSHTHDMADGTTHTHGHAHTHENADGGTYGHTHGHAHQHLPGGDETHTHAHNHDHATAPGDTHETATEGESAMSETEITPAAEAAPVQTITVEHLTALTQAIAALAESVKPIPAVVPAEEVAPEAPATETAPVAPVTEAAPAFDVEALKKEIRDGLRAEIIKESGVPGRTGYRILENDGGTQTAEQEREETWNNRTSLLLGNYGVTPVPIPGTGIAAQ